MNEASAKLEQTAATPQTLAIALERGATLSGRVVVDGGRPPATTAVSLERPTDVHGAASVSFEVGIDADGAFSIQGVMPGRYVLSATDKARRGTWSLSQASVGGRDVLDTPIDLHAGVELTGVQLSLSDRQTEVTGVLSDPAGRPLAEVDLAIIPAEARTSAAVRAASLWLQLNTTEPIASADTHAPTPCRLHRSVLQPEATTLRRR